MTALRQVQVLRSYGHALGHEDRAPYYVLELPYVARPLVCLKRLDGSWRERPGACAELGPEPVQEKKREYRDVALPVTQRRKRERNAVEPEEEVLPEPLFSDGLFKVLVSGGYYPYVHLYRLVAAYAVELPLLNRSKEARLQVRAHVADLVQKERSAFGKLELALLALDRSGERAFLKSE